MFFVAAGEKETEACERDGIFELPRGERIVQNLPGLLIGLRMTPKDNTHLPQPHLDALNARQSTFHAERQSGHHLLGSIRTIPCSGIQY